MVIFVLKHGRVLVHQVYEFVPSIERLELGPELAPGERAVERLRNVQQAARVARTSGQEQKTLIGVV
jgi:hypothetical protein